MQAYSLYELNEYIRRVVALNFDEPIWIRAEISQYKEVRGQAYLDLVDHDENSGTIKAQSNAVIWYKSLLFVRKKLGELKDFVLQEGSQVMIKVSVDFNERYGLKLVVEDIDVTYTVGQMQLAKQKILEKIKKAGFEHFNKLKPLPSVFTKIAVISSEKAAGYQDFIQQLKMNSYGYAFDIQLFPAAMQGQNVEREVVQALKQIKSSRKYDLVAIIRGGGSRLDLSYFDNYNIAHAIAHSTVPVITGIGHDIDESIADIVAHKALKTPTAVADFIVEQNMHYESSIMEKVQAISKIAKLRLGSEKLSLSHLFNLIIKSPIDKINRSQLRLSEINHILDREVQSFLTNENHRLEKYHQIINLSDPINVLKKGYSYLVKDGKSIDSITQLKAGEIVKVVMKDGQKEAEIK